jgi:light-regulated signal transduction histidine kinase (bacteriophytochrome)
MNRQQHEGITGSGLSSAILPWVEQPERVLELRQFLSEYTHRCRNSLHGIRMSMYLFRRGIEGPPPETWTMLERAYQETERLFDRLREIYRPIRTTMVRSSLGRLLTERLPVWRSSFADRGVTLEADPPAEEVVGDYDPMLVGSGLDALISWRLETSCSGRKVRLAWRAREGLFEVEWTEVDGHDCGAVESKNGFAHERSEESNSGDSLALALLARIASAHGGRAVFSGNPACHLIVRWPQFHDDANLG